MDNQTLKEFIIKGVVLDDERLKQGNQVFGKNYFDELLECIREIRDLILPKLMSNEAEN
ncbi:MAG: RhuM family protein [Candidatus Scalinduaceae bacterium]